MIALLHIAALTVFVPAVFSWTGLIVGVVGMYVFGTLGINVGYHRLLTHRAFKCPKWLERFFSLCGVCCLEGSPARWVASHRVHHKHSDEHHDPHSPLVNFLWSHIGWLLIEDRTARRAAPAKYSKDLLRDGFYRLLDRRQNWVWVYVGHAALVFLAGFLLGLAIRDTTRAAVFLGLSWLAWGVALRTVVVWHITWSVNSLTHLWGYQTFKTGENSRNNWLVGILAMGEGWHNNHHADQRAAAHGRRWWEFDATYLTIRFLRAVGLAWDIVQPKRQRVTAASAGAE